MAGTRTNPSPASGSPFPSRTNPRDHPIAPSEFPKIWSTPEGPAAREGVGGLRYTHLKRRIPRPSHVDQRSTDTGRGLPPEIWRIYSQRPTIHRPQPPRKARPFGVQMSYAARPPVTNRHDGSLGSDRKPLPQLERAQNVQPSVKDPARRGVQ